MKVDVSHYRIVVGGHTCIFEKEKDPSICRTTTTGKLLHFIVPDGAHVKAGDSIAEVEAMKMVGHFLVEADGYVKHEMVEGRNFQAGEILATLTLDDPSQIQRPDNFTGTFPEPTPAEQAATGKPHQVLQETLAALNDIMSGFAAPDIVFQPRLRGLVTKLFDVCSDRRLPLLQMQDLLATLTGRIPAEVEDGIQKQLTIYERNLTSMLGRFPAHAIDSVIYDFLPTLSTQAEKDHVFKACSDIFVLTKAYSEGDKEYVLHIIETLLHDYLETEVIFSRFRNKGDAVAALLEKHGTEIHKVTQAMISNSMVTKKNALVRLVIQTMVARRLVTRTEGTVPNLLKRLASLTSSSNSSVALTARQTLIQLKLPSYERRRNNMESIFLEAMEDSFSGTYAPEKLEKLVNSQTAVFDVLSDFIYHDSETIQQAALEVYVRRAYVAYTLTSIDHRRTPQGSVVVQFHFHIPDRSAIDPEGLHREVSIADGMSSAASSSSLRDMANGGDSGSNSSSMHRRRPSDGGPAPPSFFAGATHEEENDDRKAQLRSIISIDDLQHLERQQEAAVSDVVMRLGVMAAFTTLEELEAQVDWLKSLFENSSHDTEPINVLNIVLRLDPTDHDHTNDEYLHDALAAFVARHRDDFYSVQIRRITFIMSKKATFPKYFTFRERLGFTEDAIYRHVDPALAFKLEMFRLANYDVRHCPTRNPHLHLYYATSRSTNPRFRHDRRFFARTIMRNPDLVSKEATIELMQDAGERLLVEALDEMEVKFSDRRTYAPTDCNHVFINFVPVVEMDPVAYSKKLEKMIRRYGERLWQLRVLEAEIRMNVRMQRNTRDIPIRFVVSNVSGYYLNIHIYKEVTNYKTGVAYYRSFSPAFAGPLHGRTIQEPYPCKDRTQLKRYMAQQHNQTTYVYDFVDLFRVAIGQRWQALAAANPGVELPRVQLQAKELVLNKQNQIVEEARAPGNNTIGMVAWRMTMWTPEAPDGREMIIIANDITHVSGSFSPDEDMLFLRASQLARKLGIPRIYIAVNSGARIGLAEEVLQRFKVAWLNEQEPWRGFKYIYLTEEDYKWAVENKNLQAQTVVENGETRYKITDVFGVRHGLGVENLRGSGEIAGETSASYESNFTLTLVSCRTVGIGAYLVRLGQRTVQTAQSHIILTGHTAINKLLGKNLYSSSMQLGGPQVREGMGLGAIEKRRERRVRV